MSERETQAATSTSVEVDAARGARRRASRTRIWLIRGAKIMAGTLLALVLAELVFYWRDDGAFPHVNVYLADKQLGVRLEPGASQRFKLGTNPVSSIRINDDGYRGENFGPASPEEILVVGDSQVFGLGVEEDETFSARLAELTGRPVINGGVPTYGPLEYTAVASELLATRKIKTVVYTINFVNDLFEESRPNAERHRVWDGWAVRSETAPKDVAEFPGRKWLMSRSHLVYAWRRWRQNKGPELSEAGFASEGVWTDVVALGDRSLTAHKEIDTRVEESNKAKEQRLAQVRDELNNVEGEIENQLRAVFPEIYDSEENLQKLEAARNNPGDVVDASFSEESRGLRVTADLIRQGVRYRNALAAKIESKRGADKETLQATLGKHEALLAERATLHSRAIEKANVPSVLETRLREIKAVCDEHGAELVVLALPIDVQVSPREWEKYGEKPIDMSATTVLIDDLVASAELLGARALDTTPALAAVTDVPAFLDHDIHMTAAGHEAVAKALAAKLGEPAPLATPELSLPVGRTRVPDRDMWRTTQEITVRGSSKAGCETLQIGEWFRATCHRSKALTPSKIVVTQGNRGESQVVVTKDAMTLVTPLFAGEELHADFYWKERKQELVAQWDSGSGRHGLRFEPIATPGAPAEISEAASKLCACHEKVYQEERCEGPVYEERCEPSCSTLHGTPSPECMTTYGDDCAALLACAAGDAGFLPACPRGFANAGGTGQCFQLCDADNPCQRGTCEPWQGAQICR